MGEEAFNNQVSYRTFNEVRLQAANKARLEEKLARKSKVLEIQHVKDESSSSER